MVIERNGKKVHLLFGPHGEVIETEDGETFRPYRPQIIAVSGLFQDPVIAIDELGRAFVSKDDGESWGDLISSSFDPSPLH